MSTDAGMVDSGCLWSAGTRALSLRPRDFTGGGDEGLAAEAASSSSASCSASYVEPRLF